MPLPGNNLRDNNFMKPFVTTELKEPATPVFESGDTAKQERIEYICDQARHREVPCPRCVSVTVPTQEPSFRNLMRKAYAILRFATEEEFLQFCSKDEVLDILRTTLQKYPIPPATPTQEPVAWMYHEDPWGANEMHFAREKTMERMVPLYLHPSDAAAQIAELKELLQASAQNANDLAGEHIEQIAKLEAAALKPMSDEEVQLLAERVGADCSFDTGVWFDDYTLFAFVRALGVPKS